MTKFSEETFEDWRKPASDHEEAKLENAKLLVKKALQNSVALAKYNYEVFGQGSYANDTNVRLNSDIDLNVMFKSEAYFTLPSGKTKEDYGITLSDILKFGDYKNLIEQALVDAFGRNYVRRENKCIRILSTPNRGECDVVPTFELKRYR